MGLSQNKLALNIGVPARRINEIVLEKRRVTADELGERLEKEVRIYSEVA
jgi:plasmid maintenance system antidote protein VapI